MKNRSIQVAFTLALSLAIAASFADEKKPVDPKPADNEASLDDLLKLNPDKKPDDKAKPDAALAPIKPDAPGSLTGNESVDTILKAISEMELAGQRLRVRQDPGIETQRIQESILKRLDQAIAIAQKQKQQQQQQKQSGSGQQKQENGSKQNEQKQKGEKQQGDKKQGPSDGNKSEQVSPEKVEAAAGGPIEESRIEWGRLPARIRGELDQGLSEKFSPLYKKLTEAYYRRLAEEGKE